MVLSLTGPSDRQSVKLRATLRTIATLRLLSLCDRASL